MSSTPETATGLSTSGVASGVPLLANKSSVPAPDEEQNDMYIERGFSEETAARIRGARAWITNEYQHNGLRADGQRILGRLIDLARGRA